MVDLRNVCWFRPSLQYLRVSSVKAAAFTAKIGGKSFVGIERRESKVENCLLQVGQVALWVECRKRELRKIEAKSASGAGSFTCAYKIIGE